MNSQKFMLIALVLLTMVPGANPREIFTGAATLGISQLYPGLQEVFRNYATEIASLQTQVEEQRLQVEVAAFNTLTKPKAIVSYFQGLDGSIRQEIFDGSLPTQEEVSQVWGMMTSFFKSLNDVIVIVRVEVTDLANEAFDFISLIQQLLSKDKSSALSALAQLTMVAKCLEIAYKGIKVISNVATSASNVATRAVSAASNCGRVTLGVLRGLNVWRKSGEISTPAAAAAGGPDLLEAAEAAARELTDHHPPAADRSPYYPNDMTIDDILQFSCTMSDVNYTNLVNALKNNGFDVDESLMKRSLSCPTLTTSDMASTMAPPIDAQRNWSSGVSPEDFTGSREPLVPLSAAAPYQTVSAAAPAFAAPYQGVSAATYAASAAANSINSDDGHDFQHYRLTNDPEEKTNYSTEKNSGEKRGRTGGRTKKHLKKKKKQRKSVRKQRKTKRGKRGRSRKSRRYKK
jgi:hypothetical protein